MSALKIAALLLLGASQDSFSPARNYQLGEKDVYGLSMRFDAGQYMMSMTGQLFYEVKKLHDNGDADIQSYAGEMILNALGNEVKQPAGEIRISRYNKFGAPVQVDAPKGQKQPIFMRFLTYRPSQSLKVGETIKIEETLADAAKTQIKGSAKLESMGDGTAKVVSNLEVAEGSNQKPTKIASVTYFDTKSSKLNRLEAKVTDVDPKEMQGLPPITSITIVMERDKK